MKAAQDEPVTVRIEECDGKGLVAAGVLERIESDQADALERSTRVRLEHGGTSRQLVQLPPGLEDFREMVTQDRLEVRAVRAARQAVDSLPHRRQPARLHGDEHQEDDDRHGKDDDDRPEVRRDERVQVDLRASERGFGRV
jgi:hypothetical protein